jgi:hypothetical protein
MRGLSHGHGHRGKKIATIAISRKLLTRAWHLLADMQATSTNEPPRRP